jgi:ankyrin repeat protein
MEGAARGINLMEVYEKHSPTEENFVKALRIVLEKGAPPDGRGKYGDTILHAAAHGGKKGDTKLLATLLPFVKDVNVPNVVGMTPLHYAAAYCMPETAKILLEKGADPSLTDVMGLSSADYAGLTRCEEIVSLLPDAAKSLSKPHLEKSTSKSKPAPSGAKEEKYGRSALHKAVASGNMDRIKKIVESGVELDEVDRLGRTPLHYAAFKGNLDAVKLLLSHGAKIDAKDKRGWTPLFFAVYAGHRDIAKYLVSQGADERVKDKRGKTAGDYAR